METSPASPVNQTSLTSATKGENFSRKKSNRHSFRSEEDCNNECKWQHTGLGLDYQVDISFDQLTLIWTALRKTKVPSLTGSSWSSIHCSVHGIWGALGLGRRLCAQTASPFRRSPHLLSCHLPDRPCLTILAAGAVEDAPGGWRVCLHSCHGLTPHRSLLLKVERGCHWSPPLWRLSGFWALSGPWNPPHPS